MTRTILFRLAVAVALVVPIAAGAQTFIQKTPSNVASNLSLTMNPSTPARLKYVSGQLTVEAHAEAAKATYTATGLIVEMSVGTITHTGNTEPFQSKGSATFKTARLTFASNGDLTDIRFD